jgi:hypothetical protein
MAPARLILLPERLQECLMQERVSLWNNQIDSRTDSVMRDVASALVKKIDGNRAFAIGKLRPPLLRPGLIVA